MHKQSGIYCYHNIVNGKNYVGQSVDLTERRRQFGCKSRMYSGKIFQNAIKKYGKENFQYSILTHCKPEELNYYERFYISRLKTMDRRYGYNCTSGGDSQYFCTDECKDNMRKVWTEEKKKAQSNRQKGEKNYFYGKNHSNETRERLKAIVSERYKQRFIKEHGYSLSNLEEKLKKYVEETPYATYVDIINNFNISYKTAIKICKKIGYSSENAIQKKREEKKKTVVQCNREEHNIVLNYFPSVSIAKSILGIKGISGCLNGTYSHSGGYFWRFLNEGEVPNYELNDKYLKPAENANKLDEKTKQRIKENGGWKHDSLKKAVFCYDSNGQLIKKYDALISAKEDGFNGCDISNCCRGKVKTLYGYVFSYKELTPEEVKNRFVKNNVKPVIQMTMDGTRIRKWESATSAAKELGIGMSNINSCCHGRAKSCGGYKWVFE